jgi:hypothetical protein
MVGLQHCWMLNRTSRRVLDTKPAFPSQMAYRDFSDVFDRRQLPQTGDHYLAYQLLRNVLAAYALRCSFCVLVDARRPDLADDCYAVMKCVKPIELRTKLRISTWQEVAQAAPARLRAFLAVKYGIKWPNRL